MKLIALSLIIGLLGTIILFGSIELIQKITKNIIWKRDLRKLEKKFKLNKKRKQLLNKS